MKKLIVALMVLAVLLPAAAFGQADAAKFRKAAPGKAVEGSWIVVFNDNVFNKAAVEGLAAIHGGKVEQTWDVVNGAHVTGLSVKAARQLARNPQVAYVEQDQVFSISATQSGATWGLDRIDQRNLPLSGSYTYNFDGTGVHAYIVDTGTLATHTNFGGRATQAVNYAGGSNTDCNGHGTHVSGTVGSATYGVAKNVTLVGVKVLDCNGSGTTTGVVNGINWVTNNHISPAVANMSLGGGASSTLDNAVNASVNAGVFYAVAAGNDNQANACTKSPAGAAQAYTVGSTTSSDAMSSFSNVGSCVNIFAPGSSITSTWNTSNSATNTISGTSMASPHVAGAAALLLDENGSLTTGQIKSTLSANATSGAISGIPGGTVNLLLYSINGGAPPPPPPPPTGSCPTGYTQFDSSISAGDPDQVTSTFSSSGSLNGTLLCSGADLDLYLDRMNSNGTVRSTVASSTSSGCTEAINYSNSRTRSYRWRVSAYSGSASFTLCVNKP